MYITIAAIALLVICFLLQLTKIGSNKKLVILDILLVIIASMAIYSESVWKFTNINTLAMQELFQQTYKQDNLNMEEIAQKNQFQDNSYKLFYGVPKDGISSYFKFSVNKYIKEGKLGIYIELKSEIQSYDQALQLFGTKNLYELVQFLSIKSNLIAIDNIHNSLSKRQCYVCQVLSQIHKVNTTTIIISTKEMQHLPFLVDEYSIRVMSLNEFTHSKYRFDIQDIKQSQREYLNNLSESESKLLKSIRTIMCSKQNSCQNQNISLTEFQYNYQELIKAIEKNQIILQSGQVRLYNSFIFDSLNM